MKNTEKKEKRSMSYRTKWIITVITIFLALTLIVVCVSEGMFSFERGSVKANDTEEASATQDVQNPEDYEPQLSSYTVLVTAGKGGTANPEGKVTVDAWSSTTVTFTPDEGYKVQSVTVDGEDKGALSTYTLSYITADHTIMVTFEKAAAPQPTPEPTQEPEEG